MTRLLVVGLDCAAPHFVFDRFAPVMPNLTALRERGFHGRLRSVAPPITVPAWACMTTGLDPGALGIYGFRERIPGEYALRVATSADVRAKHVWDRIGEAGHRVAALFVPPNTPPKPVRGVSVACFLRPEGTPWTFPPTLGPDLEARFGPYLADVEGFRGFDRARIRDELARCIEQHFAIAAHILREKKPAFAMMVEIAIDRLHHAFYEHLDPAHPAHDPSSPWCEVGAEIYGLADRKLGELLAIVGDECDVLVVSDHGARPMLGGFAINDFLIARGDLVLIAPVAPGTPLTPDRVDWSRTRAFAEGGYYGRVFVNLKHREPSGVVEDREAYVDALARAFERIDTDRGPLVCRVDRPERTYEVARGFPPDLMVYPGSLDYRAIGTVGHPSLVVDSNDRGPDSCNHDFFGIVVGAGPSMPRMREPIDADLIDIAPTVLARFGLADPTHRGTDLATPSARRAGSV